MSISALIAVPAIPLWLSLQNSPAPAPPPSIRDLVRVHGISEQIIVTEEARIDPTVLLSESHLVLRGIVRSRNDRLSKDAQAVLTDYGVEVVEVVHPVNGVLSERDVVTVQRPGGAVNISGRTFVATESGFPPFSLNEEYFLFLRRTADGFHQIVGGAQGAYRVSHGNVQMFNGRPTSPAISVTEFARDVRAELERQALR